MTKVGVFYHPSFSRKSYLTVGNRLRDFPEALDEVLQNPNIQMYECPRASEELILKAHTPEMIQGVARDRMCSTAYESVGGVVAAMAALARGELARAFCFIGAGGHHAGSRTFWGACCFNDVVIALRHVREISPLRRFAIIDTDAHHGDGTRQLTQGRSRGLASVFLRRRFSLPGRHQGGRGRLPGGPEADPDQEYLAGCQGPPPPGPGLINRICWCGTMALTPTEMITAPSA